ncbi:hypothetical protein CLU79DRAFT_760670 [Phycomyces nitens]|nr:hypothetical protein CLU79DRAFT_760670 [Phycomyces nitens]
MSIRNHINLGRQIRSKVTMCFADSTKSPKKPTPILILETNAPKGWSREWQERLSEIGYMSTVAHLSKDSPKIGPEEQLNTYYKELSDSTKSLSFFPPIIIGRGTDAWRVCQKYVSNKPVSGLILLDTKESSSLPSSEFEPRFPIALISKEDTQPPGFLEGWIDHEIVNGEEEVFGKMTGWMDDVGM